MFFEEILLEDLQAPGPELQLVLETRLPDAVAEMARAGISPVARVRAMIREAACFAGILDLMICNKATGNAMAY